MPKDNPPEFVEQLEALFGAVIDKAKRDHGFAKQLAGAVGNPAKFADSAKHTTQWGWEAPDVDVEQIMADGGANGVREALRGYTRREIYALVKSKSLNASKTSNLNKTQLIDHVVRTLEKESEPYKSVFDY